MSASDEAMAGEVPPGVDAKVLEILICPVTRGPLVYDREAGELLSHKAGLAFPIRDGKPVMLESEARPIEPKDAGRAA